MPDAQIKAEPFVPSPFDTEYLKTDLKGRSVRGGAVALSARVVKLALQIGSTMVLARLLTPADFGLIAMVAAVTNFALMFKDVGLSMATVQMSDINHKQISTLFWINTGVGLLITALFVASAPAVAWFYGEPKLTAIVSKQYHPSGSAVRVFHLMRSQFAWFSMIYLLIHTVSSRKKAT